MNTYLLNRLLEYKKTIIKLKELGFVRVFSKNLADVLGISPVKVRKDFSYLKISGRNKGGYEINYLVEKIDEILGKEGLEKVIIVGVGNIGAALINYPGFENVGIKIVAGFDIDPAKIKEDTNIPVYNLGKMKDFIQREKIKIGVLAVPEVAAQRVAELMVRCGIKGILNFSPVRLKVQDCIVNDIHIEIELENLIYSVKKLNNKENKTNGNTN